MRTMHVFRATAVALVATLITATAIYAADAQPGTERAHRWESRLQQKLGLTDDQLQAIRQVYAARDANAQRQHYRALRTAQNELRRLALNGADEGALQAKQTEVQNLLAQSLQMRLQMLKQVGPILNPDQREAFAKMMDGGPRGHHHHRGERAQPQRG